MGRAKRSEQAKEWAEREWGVGITVDAVASARARARAWEGGGIAMDARHVRHV